MARMRPWGCAGMVLVLALGFVAGLADPPATARANTSGPLAAQTDGDTATGGLPAGTAMPSMAGEVGSDGVYRHGLSLDVPSFHGLEPQVGISYSSSGRNDLAGWGWSLIGDSEIERTSRGRGVPALDASDVYRLDGNDLIPCASQKLKGPSCLAGGTHSTERETFQRVSLEGSRWQVWDTNGTRSTYLDRSPFSAPGTVWKLAERTNTHGDRIIYRRWCDSGDACYLKEIEYEDSTDPAQRTRIHLRYSPRPDPYTYGVGPLVISVRYRLTALLVSTAGANRNALALQYLPASAQVLQLRIF